MKQLAEGQSLFRDNHVKFMCICILHGAGITVNESIRVIIQQESILWSSGIKYVCSVVNIERLQWKEKF